MQAHIAVASVNLATGFGGTMFAHLKKSLRPGQAIVECSTIHQHETELSRGRLLALLTQDPKPIALVGVCFRPDPATVAAYRAAGVPVVLIDEEAEGASTVATDNLAGGRLAGEHLARAGRRSVAIVAGKLYAEATYVSQQRRRGAEKALAEHGVRVAPENVFEAPFYARKEGAAIMAQLLDAGRSIDAIFCAAGDVCAAGMLAVARERRVAVPGQLAIVGYDDNPQASICEPPLTTIRQPIEEMAHEALRLATARTAGILSRPERVLLPPTLVVRASA